MLIDASQPPGKNSKIQYDADIHPFGKSIAIQLSDNETTDFEFNEVKQILLHPEVRDRKIVLLSIIGTYRKGKSFFLDYCLRFLYANVGLKYVLLKEQYNNFII